MSKKFLILITVFIDILGIGIVIPVLPFFVKSFGASDFVVTLLFVTFALLSFLSAPILGSLSDRFGRRPVLIASIFSTSVGWFVFAAAPSLLWLFIGRVIDGLAAGNISTAQSYMSDISETDKERTSNLGLIGAMFGIGLIVGPLIGGLLGAVNHALPFYVVGVLAFINVILAIFFLPETHHHRTTEKISINPLTPVIRSFKHPVVLPLMVAWFLFNIAISIQQSIFALFVGKVFNLQALGAGLIFTFIGVLILINQVFLLKNFWLAKFTKKQLLNGMLLVLALGFILTSTEWAVLFGFGIILTTFGQSLIRTVISGAVASIDATKRGENLGNMSAFMSLAMIVGPFIGGLLFTWNTHAPFVFSAIVILGSFISVHIGKVSAKI
jgi:multidrug resistance protein